MPGVLSEDLGGRDSADLSFSLSPIPLIQKTPAKDVKIPTVNRGLHRRKALLWSYRTRCAAIISAGFDKNAVIST